MNIALRVPDSLGIRLKEFAKHESISMNQFIATAIEEKMATLETYDYLEERSKKGSIKHLQSILEKVPKNRPNKEDEL
jgi:predicted DNA-binding protein